MAKTLLKVENVNFKYQTEYILKNINLTIEQGEFVVILGPRGEGKSTFLKLLSGLMVLHEGDILYDDCSLNNISKSNLMDYHRRTSFVFQDSALLSNITIFDNIALPLRYNEIYPEEDIQRLVVESLEKVKLQDSMAKLPAFISMGQKKLAALMRAILVRPETIFYDEPVANLDRPSQQLIIDIMSEEKEKGVTSILITHEFREFKHLVDKIIVLKDRSVYKIGSFDEIVNSEDTFIKGLIE